MATICPCLLNPAKTVYIILNWSMLLVSQLQCVIAAPLSWLWFSFHGLFPVACSKISRKRASVCLCWVSAANELFEVLTVHEMQHISGFWSVLQMTGFKQYTLHNRWSLFCFAYLTHASMPVYQTTNTNTHSKPYSNSINSYTYCLRVDSGVLWELQLNTFLNSQLNSFICENFN